MKKTIIVIILCVVVASATYVFGDQLSDLFRRYTFVEPVDAKLPQAVNRFAFDIFSVIEGENVVISPYSIHVALLLAYNGADEETKKEMELALYLSGMDIEEINQNSNLLLHQLSRSGLSIANALFLREDVPFLDDYKQRVVESFQAEIDSLPSTGAVINRWVDQKTKGKISEVIDDGPIDPLVIAYLINAIYFKESWKKEFDEKDTKKEVFYGTEDKEVDMMKIEEKFYYTEDENVQAVTLPYKNDKFAMHVFLPKNESFYKDISLDYFREVKEEMTEEDLVLLLPRFTIEYENELSGVLGLLGMSSAFVPNLANFGKMVDLSQTLNVYISKVIHKTFIEVNEEGTEAAAVTAIEMKVMGVGPMGFVMRVDKPFFFVIEDLENETILFMGRVDNL